MLKKKYKLLLTILVSLLVQGYSHAQISKVFYQTIDIHHKRGDILIDFGNEDLFEVEYWAGNTILVEKQLELYGVNIQTLNELIKSKRYVVQLKFSESQHVLSATINSQPKLMLNHQKVKENIFFKIYIPEDRNLALKSLQTKR